MSSAAGFLHDRQDFPDLLRILGERHQIDPGLIEKDYWIMHCLWGLQQQGWQFELKGGTSLSKGFRLIDRFSEDIDIHVLPPADQHVMSGKNHDKPAHIESRRQFFEWLASQIQIPGLLSIERDQEFDDEKFRSAGIRLNYQSYVEHIPGIKTGVLLEVGFDDTAPNLPCTISSWAMDAARASHVEVIDTRAIDVPCYSPAYTFVEKMQTVSTKFRQQQQSAIFPKNFLRHYYDLYCLLDSPEVLAFIGTPEYHARKAVRFRAGDNLDIASNEAFLLSDPQVRKLYESKYQETAALYYTGQVPFNEILSRIQQHIDKL
jgi:hypothetical protein